jgi:hypothetical protein
MRHTFSRKIRFTPDWNGNSKLPEADQVWVLLQPLKIDDLLSLMDSLGGLKSDSQITTSEMMRVVVQCKDILPKYVELNNLEDADGKVTIQSLIEYPAYLPLAMEILMKCASISIPSEVAEGNSEKLLV